MYYGKKVVTMSLATAATRIGFAGCFLLGALTAGTAFAAAVTLSANRDNSIYATGFLIAGQPLNDVNTGALTVSQVGVTGGAGSANEVRLINSFDATSMPTYSTINSITLRLFYSPLVSDISGETPFTIEVHSISAANADWTEGTGLADGGPGDNSGSNWNWKDEPTAANWAGADGLTTAGVDYDPTILASYTFNSLPADGTPIDFVFTGSSAQLTSLIDGWASLNPGFVLFHEDASSLGENKQVDFYTRQASESLRPQLIIDFEPITVPEPSTLALLGFGAIGMIIRSRRRRV